MWHALLLLLSVCVVGTSAQSANTLPPPCPLEGKLQPGDAAPPFSLLLVGGGSYSLPGPDALPLVLFVVDSSDVGGVLLATDTVELDRLLSAPAPSRGVLLLLSQSEQPGGAALRALLDSRLSFLSKEQQSAWNPHLAVASASLDTLRQSGHALVPLLDGWQSPRIWAQTDSGLQTPRVDGSYECYAWPPIAAQDWPLVGPFAACDPAGTGGVAVPDGALLLVQNATRPGGGCDAGEAAEWARASAANAAGALIEAPSAQVIGRECRDAEGGTSPFQPMLVASSYAGKPASRLSIGFTCGTGTWISVDGSGRLQTVGWRKYNEAYALRWALDALIYLDKVEARALDASFSVPLAPPGSVVNGFAANVSLTPRLLREAYESLLDFRLSCAGVGDEACGPWDRIITVGASCWRSSDTPAAIPKSIEIGRVITPFRRNTGMWLTSAAVLTGLVGNGTLGGLDEEWTCRLVMDTCCETWLASLTLRLYLPLTKQDAMENRAPFVVIPIAFPNTATHFGPDYNANRTMLFQLPHGASESLTSTTVSLMVWISGHGADAPPPTSVGCEYAPTSHQFAIGPAGAAPSLVVNTSDVAFSQYMLAGSQRGCSDNVGEGVISGGHGDWRDGRAGWCPGQAVRPVEWDVSAAFSAKGAALYELSYLAQSYYVDGSHPSEAGCGGDIVFSGALVWRGA